MCSSTKSSQLSCPLCCQTNFPNIDALRISLIKVTSRPLKCPICDDVLLGLDKLTIHLFGHTLLVENENMQKVENSKPTKKVREKKVMMESTKTTAKSKEKPHVFPLATTTPATTLAGGQSLCRCDFCGFSFQDSEILTMHMKLVHKYCDKPPEEVNFGNNNNPSDNKFQCHLCSKYFKMKGALRIHLRVAHIGFYNQRRTSRKNICEVLQQHVMAMQPPISTITSQTADHQLGQLAHSFPIQTIDLPGQQIMPLKLNYLSESPRLFPSNSYEKFPDNSISYHMTANNPLTYEIVEHRLASPLSSPTATISETGVKMWECDICSKSFTTKYFLKKHKRLHTGEMPYSCNICGKTFTFQQSYHKHLLYHSDEKPHSCSICSRSFKELSTLHNHERIHSGEKPFACETCGKCFRQRVSYLVHRRIHTGVMPYRCTACNKSFRYKVSQRTHKCTSQPPGSVVRQTGDLLQKLMQSSAIIQILSPPVDQNTPTLELTTMKTENDFINQSLDDLVNESCEKMGIEIGNSFPQHHEPADETFNDSVNKNMSSPTDRFRNLCLMSPDEDNSNFNGSLDTINEDSFKQLLYGEEH